jgi:hypothetical protein
MTKTSDDSVIECSVIDTVVLHSLDANASTSPCLPSEGTSPENERKNEGTALGCTPGLRHRVKGVVTVR